MNAKTINPQKKLFALPEDEIAFPINVAKMNGPYAATAAVQPKTPAA